MTLLDRVTAILDRAGVRYAVIGAAAMAAHGVARATYDIHNGRLVFDGVLAKGAASSRAVEGSGSWRFVNSCTGTISTNINSVDNKIDI